MRIARSPGREKRNKKRRTRLFYQVIPENRSWLNVLRLGLLVCGIGWGVSFYFTFTPWINGIDQLRAMGARPIAYQPLLDYWLKMASATFGCIGITALLACLRPQPFVGLIRLLGPFHLFLAAVIGWSAWTNHFTLQAQPTLLPDLTFCALCAGLIQVPLMMAQRQARRPAEALA